MNGFIIQVTNSVGRYPHYWSGTCWTDKRDQARTYTTWNGGMKALDRIRQQRIVDDSYDYAAVIGK